MRKYKITMNSYYQQRLDRYPEKSLINFINHECKDLITDEALDLLTKMLFYDKNLRITGKEAL